MCASFTWRLLGLVLLGSIALAQDAPAVGAANEKARARQARDLSKEGSGGIDRLSPMLQDASPLVRLAAVRSLTEIGTQRSLDPLIKATADNDSQIQVAAMDGLVNFYVSGYVEKGLSRLTSAVRTQFDKENTQIVEPFVEVRPEVIEAARRLLGGGSSLESRANAARAAGILRGKAAVPALGEALRSKDDRLIYESLIALQKIADKSAGPQVVFLVRDLQQRIQLAAIDTVGLLQARGAKPELEKLLKESSNTKVKASALGALARFADPDVLPLFEKALSEDDEALRIAAAEGIARLPNGPQSPQASKLFEAERKMKPRLAFAFTAIATGNRETGEFSPLRYLVNTLNSRAFRGVAEGYLIELSQNGAVRDGVTPMAATGTREEKLGIARVLAVHGDKKSEGTLEALSKDGDPEVAAQGLKSLRNLRAKPAKP